MRLGMNLRGNGSLSNSMLADDQDWAVALCDSADRALSLCLYGSERFRRPLSVLDGCAVCHEESWLHPAL
jgi:hypothetical protein